MFAARGHGDGGSDLAPGGIQKVEWGWCRVHRRMKSGEPTEKNKGWEAQVKSGEEFRDGSAAVDQLDGAAGVFVQHLMRVDPHLCIE